MKSYIAMNVHGNYVHAFNKEQGILLTNSRSMACPFADESAIQHLSKTSGIFLVPIEIII